MTARNTLLSAVLLACVLCGGALPTAAQEVGQVSDFSLSASTDPQQAGATENGYFVYEMAPGSTRAGTMLVKNKSDKPLDEQLAIVPAFTAQNGGSAFGAAGDAPTGPAEWVKLDQAEVSLQPGASSPVRFQVQVPAGIQPGQYLAGVAAYKPETHVPQQVSTGQDQARAVLDVQMRYVVAVQVNVPGAWNADMSISEVGVVEQPSGAFLGVRLKNSGNVFLRPSGSVKMWDENGNTVVEQAVNMGTFVPGTEVRYPVSLPSPPGPGNYNVRVELSYGDGQVATYERKLRVEAPQDAQGTSPAPAASNQRQMGAPVTGNNSNTNTNAVPVQPESTTQETKTEQPWTQYGLLILMTVMIMLLAANLMVGQRRRKQS